MIGAQSRSFRFLVRLVERLPVLVVPAWHKHRTAPIDERDVIGYLRAAATSDEPAAGHLTSPGPDVVTYGELIERIRDGMLVGPTGHAASEADLDADREQDLGGHRRRANTS